VEGEETQVEVAYLAYRGKRKEGDKEVANVEGDREGESVA
jgi:hypothetical protein